MFTLIATEPSNELVGPCASRMIAALGLAPVALAPRTTRIPAKKEAPLMLEKADGVPESKAAVFEGSAKSANRDDATTQQSRVLTKQ